MADAHLTAHKAVAGDSDALSIGDELALRAALDPGWDCVLAAYLDGVAAYGTGPWVAASLRPAWRDANVTVP